MIYAHQYIFAGLAPGATCAGCPRSPAGEPGGMLKTGYDSLLLAYSTPASGVWRLMPAVLMPADWLQGSQAAW